jgi:uncharacterized integral membrane protein
MLGDFEPRDTAYATGVRSGSGEADGVEPSPPDGIGTGTPAHRQGSAAGFLVGALAAAALVTFGFQNTASVPIRFLWFDGSVPLWFAMAAAAIAAVAVTVFLVGGAARKRRRARRRAAKVTAGG